MPPALPWVADACAAGQPTPQCLRCQPLPRACRSPGRRREPRAGEIPAAEAGAQFHALAHLPVCQGPGCACRALGCCCWCTGPGGHATAPVAVPLRVECVSSQVCSSSGRQLAPPRAEHGPGPFPPGHRARQRGGRQRRLPGLSQACCRDRGLRVPEDVGAAPAEREAEIAGDAQVAGNHSAWEGQRQLRRIQPPAAHVHTLDGRSSGSRWLRWVTTPASGSSPLGAAAAGDSSRRGRRSGEMRICSRSRESPEPRGEGGA